MNEYTGFHRDLTLHDMHSYRTYEYEHVMSYMNTNMSMSEYMNMNIRMDTLDTTV